MSQYLHRMGAERTTERAASFHVPTLPDRRALLLRIAPWVLQLVKRRESDGERQRDLYQETMLSVWLSSEPTEAARPGLAQTMEVAAEAARAHQTHRMREDEFDFVPIEEIDLRASGDPEADALLRESSRGLLAELEEIELEILALHLQGFSLVEIQATTAIPRSTVQNRLERTLRVLRAKTRIKNP